MTVINAVFESKAGEQNETGEQTGEQNHVLPLFSEGTSNPFTPTTEPERRLSLEFGVDVAPAEGLTGAQKHSGQTHTSHGSKNRARAREERYVHHGRTFRVPSRIRAREDDSSIWTPLTAAHSVTREPTARLQRDLRAQRHQRAAIDV